jgi:hypothetical protein
VTIAASADKVFPFVDDFKRWATWSPLVMGTDAEPPGCLRFAPQRGLCRCAARRDPRHLGGAGSSNCAPTGPAACRQHSKR